MMDSATIYADGSVSIDGYVPQKWRLLAISDKLAVIHSPGGSWWDNGGKHYGAAQIFTKEIESLTPGNVEGSWRVRFKRRGESNISFHPTPKEACREAAKLLRDRGTEIATRISRK